jgi:hypothetical protein
MYRTGHPVKPGHALTFDNTTRTMLSNVEV